MDVKPIYGLLEQIGQELNEIRIMGKDIESESHHIDVDLKVLRDYLIVSEEEDNDTN